MVVAGVMSGTSADGIDVAICRIASGVDTPKIKVLAHNFFRFPKSVRTAVLAAMDAKSISVADLSRLNWRLGELYADAVQHTATAANLKPQLVAIHGQTLYHQSTAGPYTGSSIRATWQTGEPAVIAERLRLPVVSDFRPADFAAGGQGAPLVPMLDYCLFRHATKNRLLLNLGGIANITALPAGCSIDQVMAFDTGPANMIIDACMEQLFGKPYDRNGATAAKGTALAPVLDELLGMKYFAAAPPKSCGREEFGAAFVSRFLEAAKLDGVEKADAIATATAFTSATILDAYARFVWPHLGQNAPLARATEMFVAGGGARNATLMRQLTAGLKPLGVKVLSTEAAGMAVEAKEAAAFALLGWLTWHGLPGNVPSATGANRPAVLGKVTYV